MSYKKASQVLPPKLLEQVQKYVDGEYLYIPRITQNKKNWGSTTATRQELYDRNQQIYQDYLAGIPAKQLAEAYFLSPKSIQRILLQMKKQP